MTVVVIAMLVAGAIYLRWAFGGDSEIRAADALVPIEQPAVIRGPDAVKSTQPIESLPPRLVDSVTGKPIWWSTGTLHLPQDALTSAGQGNDDTKCPSGEECPDPPPSATPANDPDGAAISGSLPFLANSVHGRLRLAGAGLRRSSGGRFNAAAAGSRRRARCPRWSGASCRRT